MEEEKEQQQEQERTTTDATTDATDAAATMGTDAAITIIAEPFLAGLSPSYWSHIPLCIGDIQNRIQIVNGIPCLMSLSLTQLLFPMNNCTILGTIVYADVKANANNDSTAFYVLDDGTGLMDCVSWSDSHHYALPPLLLMDVDKVEDDTTTNNAYATIPVPQQLFSVGDTVRILGRLECVHVSDNVKQQQVQVQVQIQRKENTIIEMRDCRFEIHTHFIEPVTATATNRDSNHHHHHHHGNNNGLDVETHHWMQTLMKSKTSLPASNNDIDDKNNTTTRGLFQNNINNNSAEHVLQWLGHKIRADVLQKRDLPSADDTLGAWKVFGTSCQCQVSYKDTLLYCHCQAKREHLDKDFVYRDHLLQTLLQWERQHNDKRKTTTTTITTKDDNGGPDFRFQYRDITENVHLKNIAANTVAGMEHPTIKADNLVLVTFRALRQDGILHLLHQESDTYLLISRQNVLEPYLQRALKSSTCRKQQQQQQSLPFYLRNVKKARLQYVKRCVLSDVYTQHQMNNNN